jgi:hypothetical protein
MFLRMFLRLQIIQDKSRNTDLAIIRSVFFIGCIILSSYLPVYYPNFGAIIYTILSLIIAFDILLSKIRIKLIVSLLLLFFLYFSHNHPIFITVVSSCYYYTFSKSKNNLSTFLFQISATVPVLIILIEIITQFGLPGGVYLIYFWGAPYIALAILIVYLFRQVAVKGLLILCALVFTVYQFSFFNDESEILFLTKDVSGISLSNDTLSSISKRFKLTDQAIFSDQSENLHIVFPLAVGINEDSLPVLRSSTIFLFGEHNNLNNFRGKESRFNDDLYQRQTPWITFKPFFNNALMFASNNDPLYSSNLGCTLNFRINDFPLVWDYRVSGVPILLALGTVENSNRYVFFADSDPLVPFLSPYNPQFLRTLFGLFDYRYPLEILPVLISSVLIITCRSKLPLFLAMFLLFVSIFANYMPHATPISAEINIKTNLPILSPHYDAHYSSLPAELVKNNHSVTINSPALQKLTIHLISGSENAQSDCSISNLFFLFPGSELQIEEQNFKSNNLPLGRKSESILNQSIEISDARELLVNNRNSHQSIFRRDNCTLIATSSPQRNIPAIELILKDGL